MSKNKKFNLMIGGEIGVGGTPVKPSRLVEILNDYEEKVKQQAITIERMEYEAVITWWFDSAKPGGHGNSH